ncbi:MAG TPA: pitrilysin family protein [Thermoanaerobaculia bacterium]|nr:pitrilysin family protein [Thermoanaerobaculia bacterium]
MRDRTKRAAALCLGAGLALAAVPALAAPSAATNETTAPLGPITVPSAGSPLVALHVLFDVGSIHDPAGKEGLATLTALMVGQAGTKKHTYSQLLETLYPMAASIDAQTDREVTVFSGEVHKDTLAEYTALFEEALLSPAFAPSDFERNKEELLSFLTTTLRGSSDELLGLEEIQDVIWKGHPYGHPPAGTVEGLKSITLDDVKSFYRAHYTRANLMLGVAGGYPAGYVERLEKDLAALPAGQAGGAAHAEIPPVPAVQGRSFTLIDKKTASVGIHFGYPLPINRSHPDYYPLMVANSFLGQHRTSHGRLMQQLREKRGLNYGDYSYIEYWRNPPGTMRPGPGVPRHEQFFSVWIRPVVPNTAHFALRAALYEVERLRDQGMTPAEFELTRDFLLNYSKLWAQTLSSRLGWQMDSRFYGMPYYIDEIDRELRKLSVDDVNRAAKKYLETASYDAVVVTDHAADFKAALEKDEPSPMTYNSKPGEDVLAADKTIEALKVKPTAIEIVPIDQVFQK